MRTTRFAFFATACIAVQLLPLDAAALGGPAVYVSSTALCDYPTVQDAINGVAPGTTIRLAGGDFALSAPLNLTNRQLTIRGGYPACGAPSPTSTSALRATFSGGPVVSISGSAMSPSDLVFVDLDIINGSNAAGDGGGMRVAGDGQVDLVNVGLLNNMAGSGGGMHVLGSAPAALRVNLLGKTRIGRPGAGNVAVAGGGLTCDRAQLGLGEVEVHSNVATNSGGGIRAFGGCQIQSVLATGDTRIDQNVAPVGGGIFASDSSSIALRTPRNQRLSISGNVANGANSLGGGIYLTSGTTFEADGAWIENNQAQLGGAGVFANSGASVRLGRGELEVCAIGDDHCSVLRGNRLRNPDGTVSGSGAGLSILGASASVSHTRIEGNSASNGSVLNTNIGSRVRFDNVLIVGNTSSVGLIRVLGETEMLLDFATIADNSFAGAAINVGSTAPLALDMRRSIFLVGAGQTHVQGSGAAIYSCLNTGVGGALGGDSHAPGFFDQASGMYRLDTNSANLDRCAVDGAGSFFDISGRPRLIDRPSVANNVGPLDRGAYEDADRLFANGFEN